MKYQRIVTHILSKGEIFPSKPIFLEIQEDKIVWNETTKISRDRDSWQDTYKGRTIVFRFVEGNGVLSTPNGKQIPYNMKVYRYARYGGAPFVCEYYVLC